MIIIDRISNRVFGVILILIIALQVIPTVSNMWDVGGWSSLVTLLFPPVLIYRLFLSIEFKDSSYVYRMMGQRRPIATLLGDDILGDVDVKKESDL